MWGEDMVVVGTWGCRRGVPAPKPSILNFGRRGGGRQIGGVVIPLRSESI